MSEQKQRTIAHEEAGDNITSEMVPFVFTEAGKEAFCEVPLVYVSNLMASVGDRLTAHLRYKFNN